jgi:hypothetical protein
VCDVLSIPNSNSNKKNEMREKERATYVAGVDSSGSPVSSQGQLPALVLFFLSLQTAAARSVKKRFIFSQKEAAV